jgi:DAK2 domain fusion protein YloV
MGARGNSGIILSQVVRGLCEQLGGEERLDTATLARALRGATDVAYRAVRQPVEGTMLTVIREMAEAAEAAAAEGAPLDAALDATLARGEGALARTPTMLAALHEANVVDSGGAGLVELLRGAIAGWRGEELEERELAAPPSLEAGHLDYSVYRYCTNFLVEGPDVDTARLERELASFGDSLLVVADDGAAKVHVHTDDPGRALSLATAMGVIDGVDIANMHEQTDRRTERLTRPALAVVEGGGPAAAPDRRCDAVCVVAGEGNRRLVESLGARGVVEGGQTMNPSTQELVDAIERCAAAEVVVLPNNPNVILAAEQAASVATRPVVVVASRSIPAGLAAMVAYDPDAGAAENAEAMARALANVRTGEVTSAVRDARADGVRIRKGDYLALLDGQVVAAVPAAEDAVREVAERLLSGGGDVLTVLRGDRDEAGSLALDEALAAVALAHPTVDIEVHDGGQPHYPVLLSAE